MTIQEAVDAVRNGQAATDIADQLLQEVRGVASLMAVTPVMGHKDPYKTNNNIASKESFSSFADTGPFRSRNGMGMMGTHKREQRLDRNFVHVVNKATRERFARHDERQAFMYRNPNLYKDKARAKYMLDRAVAPQSPFLKLPKT